MRTLSSIIGIIFILLATPAVGQNANPFEGNPRAIAGGGALFRAQCATCHGADAKGISSIDAPDLTMMWAERQRTAEEVFGIIRDGIPGSIMPPHGFIESELWMLVSYLQNVAVSGVIGLPPGDSNNGASLFAANCSECHRANTTGGSLGPNLSNITQRRSLDSLITSVRNPSDMMRRGYKSVTVITDNNERVQGVLKSEDAFSIQLLDTNQRLRAFMKTTVRDIEHGTESLMPAFSTAQLSEQNLIDILNFLNGP